MSKPGETRQKADLCLDLLADGLPAHRDFGRLTEQGLGDEAFALNFQPLRIADLVRQRGLEGDGQRDGGDLAGLATGEEIVRFLQRVHHRAVELATADGKIAGEENAHDLFAEFGKAFGRQVDFLFQRVVIDQYFHS